MTNEIFKYNENPITFQNGDHVMVNAAEMAKPFNKKVAHFLRNQQTLNFLTELRNRISTDPVVVIHGDGGGTWMHEKLALKFAAWLSPEFELWIYDRIKELMQHGMTATPETLEAMINDPELVIGLATKLKEQRLQLAAANARIEKDAPRVNYVSQFFDAKGTMSIGEMAKTFDIGPNKMFEMLRRDGFLLKNPWNIARQIYVPKYFVIKLTVKGGQTFRQSRVTSRGHAYFAKKYNLFSLEVVNPI